MRYYYLILPGIFWAFMACQTSTPVHQAAQWQKLTLSFNGPPSSEQATNNPFTDYRLTVTFTQGTQTFRIPGFYAADGNAAESSADSGNVWQVRFRPPTPGQWQYQVSFRQGEQIAVSDEGQAGTPLAFDGEKGVIEVVPAGPEEVGRLVRTEARYLQYAESKRYFLKGGADSPENLLGYADFDGTQKGSADEQREGEASNQQLHRYEPHISDWQTGDPTWQNDKGKGLIGGLNYLATKGVNSVYFLTMNIEGDGKDVWPYTAYDERERFDCSKLDQWEIVFDHMDQLGLMLHIVTQETENELLLDEGDTGFHRKLYYRELIARFAHHKAVTWNMGEENGPADFSPNGQTLPQQKAMVAYIKTHDPYQNMVVIHSHSWDQLRYEMFDRLLDDPYLDGISIQVGDRTDSHQDTQDWLQKSAAEGSPWVVCIDEIGHHSRGIDPDNRPNNNQDSVRAEVLWANLMAGGAGVEWYFGYANEHNDLGCEDWRSRDRVWDFTHYALHFFQTYLPFAKMHSADSLVAGDPAYCFAKEGEVYAIYLLRGGEVELDLRNQEGTFSVSWYNPREGGALQKRAIAEVKGGSWVALGATPVDGEEDWAILLQKKNSANP